MAADGRGRRSDHSGPSSTACAYEAPQVGAFILTFLESIYQCSLSLYIHMCYYIFLVFKSSPILITVDTSHCIEFPS